MTKKPLRGTNKKQTVALLKSQLDFIHDVFDPDWMQEESRILKKYMELDEKLNHIRYVNDGKESQEEDRILEEMDELWYKLNEDDKNKIGKGER
jgi:hypothetical protein